jgi:tetratricopeptide (TPR) repeat protein
MSVKYADMLGILDRYDEAASILERIERTADAPAYIRQWLGYYLIKVDRSDEAIQYSKKYHEQFPDESDTFFNIARAYAHKYCNELTLSGEKALPKSENRDRALENEEGASRSTRLYRDTEEEVGSARPRPRGVAVPYEGPRAACPCGLTDSDGLTSCT